MLDGTLSSEGISPRKRNPMKNSLRRLKMSSTLIAIVGVVYAVVAADLLFKGNTGLGIAFVGYALGNVGLYMEAAK
jgi:hypothetical protein